MPTKTVTVKALRAEAKAANIDGWEDMDKSELEEALSEVDEGEDDESDEDEDSEDDTEDDEDDEEEEVPVKSSSRVAKAKAAAKRSTVKKSPAQKASAKKSEPAAKKKVTAKAEVVENENGNPFRADSNLFHITEALMKGGKRSVMVTRLLKKIDLKPRVKGGKDYDESEELDYRIVRACQQLKNEFGFVIEKDGRGPEQKVQAVAPQDQ